MPRKTTLSSIRTDATYVITGGSGGLVYSFARWLVEQGAKHIILASRSGKADTKTRNLIEELRDQGATVLPHKCDVTDRHQVNELVGQSLRHIPPIRGVIHGAMDNRVSFYRNLLPIVTDVESRVHCLRSIPMKSTWQSYGLR